MKKYVFLLILPFCFLLTGCSKENERNAILKELCAKGIIKEEWNLLGISTVCDSPIPIVCGYDYIFYTNQKNPDKNKEDLLNEGIFVVQISKEYGDGMYEIRCSKTATVQIQPDEREKYAVESRSDTSVYHMKRTKFLIFTFFSFTD